MTLDELIKSLNEEPSEATKTWTMVIHVYAMGYNDGYLKAKNEKNGEGPSQTSPLVEPLST